MSDPLRHRAECESCGREEIADGSMDGFRELEHEFSDHIDDGTACHGYGIWAVYEGGEERVA